MLAWRVAAGLALETAAGASHHGCAPKGTSLPLIQRPSVGPIPTTTARCEESLRTARLLPRDSECRFDCDLTCATTLVLEAAVGTSHYDRAPKGEASRLYSVLP